MVVHLQHTPDGNFVSFYVQKDTIYCIYSTLAHLTKRLHVLSPNFVELFLQNTVLCFYIHKLNRTAFTR